ncbi:MAG: chemotaxis protein CheW [Clostridia bacterium]|nr:chemotaxis protein CheW [Clostridia bacterium]
MEATKMDLTSNGNQNGTNDLQEENVDEVTQKNLTFTIGDEIFGIQIENVTQIIGIQHITYIPNQADYVKGVINLRGQIIPVMEVRTKFKKPVIDYDDRTCIIVVSKDEITVGLIVDRVSEVLNIKESEISATPTFNKKERVEYIKGIAHVNEDIIMLLDMDKMLDIEKE